MAVAVLIMGAGCNKEYTTSYIDTAKPMPKGKCMTVAVMPFQGVSESPGSGLIAADVLSNELYALGGYNLITPETVSARLSPKEGETLSVPEYGKLTGATYILTGRVNEYTYKSGVGEQPAVAISARLIDTESGKVLWASTQARTGSAAWFQEDSLGLLMARVCSELAKSIDGEAKKYGWSDTRVYPAQSAAAPLQADAGNKGASESTPIAEGTLSSLPAEMVAASPFDGDEEAAVSENVSNSEQAEVFTDPSLSAMMPPSIGMGSAESERVELEPHVVANVDESSHNLTNREIDAWESTYSTVETFAVVHDESSQDAISANKTQHNLTDGEISAWEQEYPGYEG